LDEELLPQALIDKMVIKMDFDNILPGVLIKNTKILRSIHMSNISSEKLVSLIYYKPECVNYIDIKNFKFKKEDIIGLVINHGELIDYFDVDLSDFKFNEIIMMCSVNEDIKYRVDFSKFKQTTSDIRNIVNNHINKKYIVDLIDFSVADGNQARLILKKYGDEYINKLDLKKMKPNDWIDVLKTHPELLDYCDINIFKTGDYLYLADLICIYEHLDYLVDENKSKFSAFDTEKLIIKSPERFLNKVDLNKLRDKNWLNIVKQHPFLRNRYYFC